MAKKRKSLLEFYTNTLQSLGLEVADDGYIYVGRDKHRCLMQSGDKLLVLPTTEQIKTVMEHDEDGSIKVVKVPYNPLNEDTLKGDSASLKKTKTLVERRLGHAIAIAGELLLTVAADNKLQKGLNLSISSFLKSIHVAKNANIKSLVDEQTFTNWNTIYGQSLKQEIGMISVFLKKNGVYNGAKYNRLAVTNSSVYDALCLATKENNVVNGAKLRQKDITIFKLIFEFLLEDMEDGNSIYVGSSDKESPAFIALMRTYIKISEKLNMVLEALKSIAQHKAEDAIMNICITDDELDDLSIYAVELGSIPNELDLTRSPTTNAAMRSQEETPPWESAIGGTMKTPPPLNVGAPVLPDQYSQPMVPTTNPLYGAPALSQHEPAGAVDPVLNLAYGTPSFGGMAPGMMGFPMPMW